MTKGWILGHVGQLVIFFDLLFLMMMFAVEVNFCRFDHIVPNPLFLKHPPDGHGYRWLVTMPYACCLLTLSDSSRMRVTQCKL